MIEWTEQEEQQLIALAKQGDPKANYELSLWALQRGEEEPDEGRWNRLAAKCLVKAAQAGYAPAQARMAELLHASGAGEDDGPARPSVEPRRQPRPVPREPVRLSDARQAQATARRAQSQPAVPQSTARRPVRQSAPAEEDDAYEADEEYDDSEEDYDEQDDDPRGRGRGGRPARGGTAGWGEYQWRRLEIICVAVCAILLVAIAVMIITSRSGGGTSGTSAIPPAGEASAGATPEPTPSDYPPEDIIEAIEAAELEIPPADDEYVTVPTTATVRVSSTSLRLRTGPNTEYKLLATMPNDTEVNIYATKNDWCLVLYEGGEDGPVYGWCSSEYLFITAGAANAGSVG